METYFRKMSFFCLLVLLNSFIMKSQTSFGIFDNATDVGKVKFKGSVEYNAELEKYTLSGAGKNLWFGDDEFYFVWKKIKGNFTLYSWLEFVGKGVELHRKGGLIIRESFEPGSRYISIAYHGDGLVSMQYRPEKDSMTKEFKCPSSFLSVLQLEKTGDKITSWATDKGNALQKVGEINMKFDTSGFYVGLFVCSHNPDVVEKAIFSNTRLTIPVKEGFKPYQDYIGSRLEILDIETGTRKIIYESEKPFEAPNWSRDGKFLVFNSKGLLYGISAEGGKPELINTAFANANNNDHGISPDDKQLVISNHVKDRPDGENSLIFVLPIGGGVPKQITDKGPSYWHGWSPDGKYLIYTGKRNNQWGIYRIPATGGEETQLTNSPFLDDGSEYSTDGNYIWFNSNRTGKMQIWKMKNDGSEQTQITFDEYQNWFAHQSPDGKKLIMLSFPPEVDSWDHPYYKHVLLRLMDVGELKPKVVAHLYGGQGTINVASWSPDSKKIAFVSNSDFK